jgi:hypothetical protein
LFLQGDPTRAAALESGAKSPALLEADRKKLSWKQYACYPHFSDEFAKSRLLAHRVSCKNAHNYLQSQGFRLPFQVNPMAHKSIASEVTPSPAARLNVLPKERATPQGIQPEVSAVESPLRDGQDQDSVDREERVVVMEKVCQGWTSLKYDPLFQKAYHAAFKSSRTMANALVPIPSFSIPLSLSKVQGVKQLVFVSEGQQGYVLRSINCSRAFTDSGHRVLCTACSVLTSRTVSPLYKQVTAMSSRPVSHTTHVGDISPSKLPQLIDFVRKRKRYS